MMDRKMAALEFLRRVREGNRPEAEKFLAAGARHHNAYFAAGMPALLDAAAAAAKTAPERRMTIKRVLADGDYVAVHSHVQHKPGDAGVALVHILRFEGDRIAEVWDIGQPVPADNPNADGMF